jgi:hypothetical protein
VIAQTLSVSALHQLKPRILLQVLLQQARNLLTNSIHLRALSITPVGIAAGAVAARLLTEQLAHWLFSQLWGPYWLAAGTTARLYQHMTQHLLPASSSGGSSSCTGSGKAASAAAAAAALDACACQVALLARLASLSEQQVVPQLAGDVGSASR